MTFINLPPKSNLAVSRFFIAFVDGHSFAYLVAVMLVAIIVCTIFVF